MSEAAWQQRAMLTVQSLRLRRVCGVDFQNQHAGVHVMSRFVGLLLDSWTEMHVRVVFAADGCRTPDEGGWPCESAEDYHMTSICPKLPGSSARC